MAFPYLMRNWTYFEYFEILQTIKHSFGLDKLFLQTCHRTERGHIIPYILYFCPTLYIKIGGAMVFSKSDIFFNLVT